MKKGGEKGRNGVNLQRKSEGGEVERMKEAKNRKKNQAQ